MEVHYTPETIVELRRILYGCPYLMKVEVTDDIPLQTKTVADLRKLTQWSSDWSLAIPFGRDPWNTVRVEHRTASAKGRIANIHRIS
jgi:hypothetical protein